MQQYILKKLCYDNFKIGDRMKVVKRNGSIVEYNANKIHDAIEKANNVTVEEDRIGEKEIQEIIHYIEKLDKKRMLVEDIQDIIEFKLMEYGKYALAKKYIVYRYNRALVRKQNTTDESILTIIKDKSRNTLEEEQKLLASAQRDFIAGEVSKDLTQRILLPDKLIQAHEKGILYFHHMDYFLQPIINYSNIRLKDMLDQGTIINGHMIESPKSFLTACNILTQILALVESGQYGGEVIDIKALGKYVGVSRAKWKKLFTLQVGDKLSEQDLQNLVNLQVKKEIESGIQTIYYQLNIWMASNGKKPSVTFLLHLDEKDEYVEENKLIISEILKQRIQGIKGEDGTYFSPLIPDLVYVLDENNNLTGGKYDDITRISVTCSKLRKSPSYLSALKMKEQYGGIFSPTSDHLFFPPCKNKEEIKNGEGRFNQGIVTINLPQIALATEQKEELFWEELEKRLELCFDALMRKHYSLLGTSCLTSPIHWCYGGISRLEKREKIDSLLKGDISNLTLGYVGLFEVSYLMTGGSPYEKEGKNFIIKLLKKLNKTLERWKEETSVAFTLSMITDKQVTSSLLKKDFEQYGYQKQVTDKEYYGMSQPRPNDIIDYLEWEESIEKYSLGGFFTSLDEEQLTDEIITFISHHNRYVGFENKN